MATKVTARLDKAGELKSMGKESAELENLIFAGRPYGKTQVVKDLI